MRGRLQKTRALATLRSDEVDLGRTPSAAGGLTGGWKFVLLVPRSSAPQLIAGRREMALQSARQYAREYAPGSGAFVGHFEGG
jgi:hypothetical protein